MAKEAVAASGRPVAGPIRVTIPANIAFNADSLKRTITNLAELIGCPRCFSGADCLLQMERHFIVEGTKLMAARGPSVEGPSPEPWVVSVALAPGVKRDLTKVLAAVDKVNGMLGCMACTSGFDIHFREALDLVVVNEKLEAQGFGPHF
jgi:hypothetical protein